jgi:hypothetical protein
MGLRWTAAGVPEAERYFREIAGCIALPGQLLNYRQRGGRHGAEVSLIRVFSCN